MDVRQEIRFALESRLASLAIATTGTMTLASGGSSYTRSSGSFITDGFAVGDAVRAYGFGGTANGLSFVTAVTALSLTVDRAVATFAAAGGRIIEAGIPETSWPGIPFAIPTEKPWLRARVRNAGQVTVAVSGLGNIQRHIGIFLIDIFEPYLSGAGIFRIERLASAISQHFRVTTSIVRPNLTVRISGMQPGSVIENEDNLQIPLAPEFWADAPGI